MNRTCQVTVILLLVTGIFIPVKEALAPPDPDEADYPMDYQEDEEIYSYVEDKRLRVRFNFSDESNELKSREKRSSDRNQACEMLIAIDEPLYQHYQRNMTKVKKPQQSIRVHS